MNAASKPFLTCRDCLAAFSVLEHDNPVAALIAHRAKAHAPPAQTGAKPAPRWRAK